MEEKYIKGKTEYNAEKLRQLELQGWDLEELWFIFNTYEKSCILKKLSCETKMKR